MRSTIQLQSRYPARAIICDSCFARPFARTMHPDLLNLKLQVLPDLLYSLSSLFNISFNILTCYNKPQQKARYPTLLVTLLTRPIRSSNHAKFISNISLHLRRSTNAFYYRGKSSRAGRVHSRRKAAEIPWRERVRPVYSDTELGPTRPRVVRR